MLASDRRLVVLVGGPNGAGKSTFIRQYIAVQPRSFELLNADDIAREGAGLNRTAAGKEFIARRDRIIEARANLIIETTLAGLRLKSDIPKWQGAGYRVIIHYLALPDVQSSIARVRARVAAGGHGIPVADLERRFPRSRENFETVYKPLVDAWYVRRSVEGAFLIDQFFQRDLNDGSSKTS